MPKGIKSATPRKRKPSDDTAVIRKRLKRRIAKLEKLEANAGARKDVIRERKVELSDMLKATYGKRGDELKNTLASIEREVPAIKGRARRSDAAFKRRLREMGRNENVVDMVQNKVFWMSTKDLWVGRHPSERAELIKKAYGVSTLEDAFNVVMELNKDLIGTMVGALSVYDSNGAMPHSDFVVADAEDPYEDVKPYLMFVV